MADGGYRGNSEVIMPYRKHFGDHDLPPWQEELNTTHRRIRARIEHTLAGMKTWKILRDYRRAAATLGDTASRIAHLRNLALNLKTRSTVSSTSVVTMRLANRGRSDDRGAGRVPTGHP